ncbi:unnamed protein product [Somion occarium]|uniref:Uncharacterized protein n=2 Tax=Somion occarium TaxID=3059160 RepID=A0ABP1CV67_9APHY
MSMYCITALWPLQLPVGAARRQVYEEVHSCHEICEVAVISARCRFFHQLLWSSRLFYSQPHRDGGLDRPFFVPIYVSDSSGFGSGGTSGAVTVLQDDDSSCYDSTKTVSPAFSFSIVPAGQLTQCSPTRIWWDPALVQGTPSFQGVIPGGQSFAVPQGNLTTVAEQGLGFTWTPPVRGGTTVILLGGDNRGPGTAGSSVYVVNAGENDCLSDSSPSSTPGSPAGGAYPTSTSSAGGSNGGSHTNIGAIVGGVIGGVVFLIALILILLFFRRRSDLHQSAKERPVDLLRDDEHEQEQIANQQLPRYYEPEPFMVPDPTVASSAGDYGDDPGASVAGHLRPSTDRRYSRYSGTTSDLGLTVRSPTPDQSTSTSTTYMRKSPAPPSFRPVNIVQHEDAGPGDEPPPEEPETIELPPAYTNIKQSAPPGPGPSGAGASSADTADAADAGTSDVTSTVPRNETSQA